EPWSFGEEVLNIARKHANRRYRLMHYLNGLMRAAHETGEPLVRPCWYHFPYVKDPVADQFFLGPDLLACPVLQPGLKKRQVSLPPGEWFEFESGKRYQGDQTFYFETRPGYFPLFVRGGAALPVCPARRNAEESVRAGLIIEVYPGSEVKGKAILDDGLTLHQKPMTVEINGRQNRTGQLQIQIRVEEGDYSPAFRNLQLRLPGVFRHMIGANAVQAQSVDSAREDRTLEMVGFDLPLKNDSYDFDFRNVIQGSS
ncbi:MAG: hypothetical protein KDK25_10065, partial [Leptospiraceae bacterium]|nr:hypothetical protein [Leptospiraceae bacterium]